MQFARIAMLGEVWHNVIGRTMIDAMTFAHEQNAIEDFEYGVPGLMDGEDNRA